MSRSLPHRISADIVLAFAGYIRLLFTLAVLARYYPFCINCCVVFVSGLCVDLCRALAELSRFLQ